MKAQLTVDPARCACGEATRKVRWLLAQWAAIDWFVPRPPRADDAELARALLREHARRAAPLLPDRFAPQAEVRVEHGGWAEFDALVRHAQTHEPGWDWKFSALKPLTSEHSERRGWELDAQGRFAFGPGATGDANAYLFARVGEHVMWNSLAGRLEWGESPPHRRAVDWYYGWAAMDLLDAVEWYLAEPQGSEDGNPFVPLLRCYAAGLYPFCFARDAYRVFVPTAD